MTKNRARPPEFRASREWKPGHIKTVPSHDGWSSAPPATSPHQLDAGKLIDHAFDHVEECVGGRGARRGNGPRPKERTRQALGQLILTLFSKYPGKFQMRGPSLRKW